MTISGPDALRALDEALRDIRQEEDEIMRKLARAAERLAKIRETQGALLLQVAAGRLDGGRLEGLSADIAAAEAQTHSRLAGRNAEVAAATRRLEDLDHELGALATERATALAALDRQQAALRGLSSRIAAAIARDPAYEGQQQLAARLKAVAAAARAKARQADLDREQKGRPYRADPLFTYLLGRRYGTPDYRARGLVAWLDGRLAALVGFTTAEAHYRMLNQLPALLHAHAEQQAARAALADEALDGFEQAAIDAAGGSSIRAALAEAQQQIAAIDARLLAVQDARDAAAGAQTLLTDSGDPALDAAIGRLARALGSPDLPAFIAAERLMQRGVDDPLISQLNDTRLRVGEEMLDAREQHARLATLAGRRRELEDIEYEFKAHRFDDPRSLFRDDDLVAEALNDFLTGEVPAQGYWNAFRRSQAWSVGTSDWGGGVGLPRRGRQAAEAGPAREPPSFNRPRTTTENADAGA